SLQENNSPTMNSTGYHQLLVTPSLLKGLGAQMGDEVVLLLQDKNNMQQAVLASITGVVDYALPTSQTRIVWMDSATLASRLATNNEVSEIVVKTQPGWELEPIQQELQHRLGGDLIVETYLEVAGFFKDVINIQNSVYNAILFVVFAIVISAIVNTSLMTVMERVREIGTLMALGYRRKHILFLFLCESAFIGLTGGLAGLLFIRTLLWILSIKGLRFPLPGERIPTIFYPFVELPFLIFVLILAVTSALVASFFPAYRASRMKPVDALAQT
ncbi:MAG: ABC transporter permease, partial [Bdellovibrionales bacterium]|nr:ABC transporter permease [Bdellovibrionales bacterium]